MEDLTHKFIYDGRYTSCTCGWILTAEPLFKETLPPPRVVQIEDFAYNFWIAHVVKATNQRSPSKKFRFRTGW